MQTRFLLLIIILFAITVSCDDTLKETASDDLTIVEIEEDIVQNQTCAFENKSENSGLPKISGHTSVVFKDKIWLVGGKSSSNSGIISHDDIWTSTDGINWELAVDSPGFAPRYNHSCLVFQDKLWVIGGRSWSDEFNDIWSSEDGLSWKKESDDNIKLPSTNLDAVVFKDEIWLLYVGTQSDASGRAIWSSSNGTDWKLRNDNPTYPQRRLKTATVFKNKIWLIGGFGRDPVSNVQLIAFNDIWSSDDGINWIEETAMAEFPARMNHSVIVYDNRIWIAAGSPEGAVPLSDVWYSEDGKNWTSYCAKAFSGRIETSLLGFNNNLWVFAGNDIFTEGDLNDILTLN